jgi:hypothetical protein
MSDDLETLLRQQAAQDRRERDPGDLFWARLPRTTWEAWQAETQRTGERRRRRRRWLLLAAPIVAAAATLLIWLPGRAPRGAGEIGGEALLPLPAEETTATFETTTWELNDAQLSRLAGELGVAQDETLTAGGGDDVPVEVLVERLSESELARLAAHLRRS